MKIYQAFLLVLVFVLFISRADAAKKHLRTATATATATATNAPFLSHAKKCSEEGSYTLINVFLNPPVPRKGDKVSLSVFYYAAVEVEDPDLVFAFSIGSKIFTHKSSLCDNKLSKQEIHNRHLDEDQIAQDDNDTIAPLDDTTDITSHSTCQIRAGEHLDNIDLTWLYMLDQPFDMTMIYSHNKIPLLCAGLTINTSH